MKLKLDENIGHRGIALLQESGHDVATVVSQGLQSAADDDLIAVCRGEHRCLVTLDLHFANPLRFNPKAYHGIAVLRLPSRPVYSDLIESMKTLVAGLNIAPIDGRLWIIQAGRIREHIPGEIPN